MTTTTLEVEGMTCASCAGRVERAAKAVPGVTEASVNLAMKTLRADFSSGADPAALAAAVKKAGYDIGNTDTRLNVEGMTCASCVGRIERALKAWPGVTGAEVNLATGDALVHHLAGSVTPSELAAVVKKAGYEATPVHKTATAPAARHDAEAKRLRASFIWSLVLTLPVFLVVMSEHMIPGAHAFIAATIGERTSWIIQFLLTTAVLAFPGRQFLTHGVPTLLRAAPDMNSLVALGASAAWAYSTVATFAPGLLPPGSVHVYFEAAATICTLILLGRMLEARAKGRAGEAIAHLLSLAPAVAHTRRGGTVIDLPVEELRAGDVIEVRPGERIAADGAVVEGTSYIDRSMLTGEPQPVEAGPGDEAIGGTVNGQGALALRVTRTGDDATLARIIRMVSDAQGAKLPIQALVDRITLWFVPAVMAVALLTVLAWLVFGPAPVLGHALVAGVSVLIIACPCAMGLATPTSIMVGTGRGAELGLLFRKGDALQRLEAARVIAFDKTGTLTLGHPTLVEFTTAPGANLNETLTLVAAAEARSEHPIARAILAETEGRGLALPEASDAAARPGLGLLATVEGRRLAIGTSRLMEAEGINTTPLAERAKTLAAEGKTTVLAAIDGKIAAVLAVTDPPKDSAASAIAALHKAGVKTALITGDSRATAERVAATLGIDHVVAEVLPEGKLAAIEELRAAHGPTAFVGDGINDAPALAAADVGLAIGTGTDVAIETADLVLMSGDPQGVASALELSRATMRNIRQNLGWAFGYNVVLIPVAAGVLYPFGGPLLSPMLAAGAMAASSVIVVSNALRLRRYGRRT
ncbi:heavy metal translocating P-type ATPase [Solirhodobacter olei]|uniref:heavy metal translocating P-type ATPase n=1 Tax=Solirhodobacter olei TaxID=2493082 RepID=UPI000FDBCB9B|nr:heavy metal translocating P-type ATPase [Solirhodobacter olei]